MADFRELCGWFINRDRVEMAIVVYSEESEIESGNAETHWSIDLFLIDRDEPMVFWCGSKEEANRLLREFVEVANANGAT